MPCHACKLELRGHRIEAPRLAYRSGRSRHWVKSKNPACAAAKREAEKDWRPRWLSAARGDQSRVRDGELQPGAAI